MAYLTHKYTAQDLDDAVKALRTEYIETDFAKDQDGGFFEAGNGSKETQGMVLGFLQERHVDPITFGIIFDLGIRAGLYMAEHATQTTQPVSEAKPVAA